MTAAPTTPSSDRVLDAVTLGVYWNRLIAIAEESSAALVHTAFSRIVTEVRDFSTAIFDARGHMIAQPNQGFPGFLGCLSTAVKRFMEVYPEDSLDEGDVLLTNDPWIGASQLNDIFVVTPVFYAGKIVGYAASVAHCPDIGGGALLSAESKDIFGEGLQLPILKVMEKGVLNELLLRIFKQNVRIPDIAAGDLMGQLSANDVARRRIVEFLDETGLADLTDLGREILRRSELAMRRSISAMPDGEYRAAVDLDGFDEPLQIQATVTVAGDSLEVDFEGTSPESAHGLNCTFNFTYGDTLFPVVCIASPDSPVNAGSFLPITVSAPEGSLLNPRYPAPLGARTYVTQFIQAAIFRALSNALPDRVIADSAAPQWAHYVAGEKDRDPFVEVVFLNGGLGARPLSDGISTLGFPVSAASTRPEVFESEMPFLVDSQELVCDSAGPGRHRGGLGQRFVLRCMNASGATFVARCDRIDHPPQGLHGGRPAGAGELVLNERHALHSKRTITLERGDTVTSVTPGGGGYGDPFERSSAQVLADYTDAYISLDGALRDYGVVIDTERLCVDEAATAAIRNTRLAAAPEREDR